MNTGKDINEIIIAAFAGEANSDEMNQLKNWLQESEKNQRTFEILRSFWNNSYTSIIPDDQQEAFQKLQRLINKEAPVIRLKRPEKKFSTIRWVSVAAAVTLVFLVAVLTFQRMQFQDQPAISYASQIEKSNQNGRKSRIILPDSSIVWLNSASRIVYNNDFGNSDRVIQLDGEAYFEVRKNANLPFKVITGNIITTALGTSFNINNFNDLIRISLITGKVKVENSRQPDSSTNLVPGEGIVYDINELKMTRQTIDINETLYWKNNILSFRQASFSEVIDRLEKWYGVEFIIDDQLNREWNFTGKFYNENLENVLLSISFAKKFDFDIDHQNVYLKSKDQSL